MEHPLGHLFSHRLPRAAHVSCTRKGKPRHRDGAPPTYQSLDITDSLLLHVGNRSCRLCGPARRRTFVDSNLVAASDLLHAPVISPNRHCPAAWAAEPALISIVVMASVTALSPTGSAGVNPNPAGAYVHTLSKGRCRRSGSQCAHHSERRERCLKPHRVSPFLFLSRDRNTKGPPSFLRNL
jgi:hypothetical protein